MNIDVVLSPELYDYHHYSSDHVVVAVDILRATTAICAAFSAGASLIIPLDTLDPLPRYYQNGYTIAAERGGKKVELCTIPGGEHLRTVQATCGNSPTEYLNMNLQSHRIAYSTTNGTRCIIKARNCRQLFVGSFANISILANTLHRDVVPISTLVILCSGWEGAPCIEDTLFAGALTDQLEILRAQELDKPTITKYEKNDAAMMALDLWKLAHTDPYTYCLKASHVHRLQKLGYDNDIQFAFRQDTCPVVPQMTDHETISRSR